MPENKKFKHETDIANVRLLKKWFRERDGILVWESVNLSDPGRTVTTPALGPDFVKVKKPDWWCADEPKMHIKDPSEVGVIEAKEVKRFHVGVRMGGQGMCLKVTDGGTRRIRQEVEKAEEKYGRAWYEFDYGDEKNAVIMVPSGEIKALSEYPDA